MMHWRHASSHGGAVPFADEHGVTETWPETYVGFADGPTTLTKWQDVGLYCDGDICSYNQPFRSSMIFYLDYLVARAIAWSGVDFAKWQSYGGKTPFTYLN